MIEVVRFVLLKRRKDITHAQFSEYWRSRHVEVLLSAGLKEYNLTYTQNHFQALPGRSPEQLRFDGCPQMLQSDPSVIRSGFQQDPRYSALVRPDEAFFLDSDKGVTLFTDIHVVKDGPKNGCKIMVFACFSDGDAGRIALNAWGSELARTHEDIVLSASHYHTIESRGPTPHFDVVLEYWVPSDAEAAFLFGTLERSWPAPINRGSAFSVISHPHTFY